MVKQLFVIAAIMAVAMGYPQYYLVPVEDLEEAQAAPTLVRNRRQTTSGGVDNKGVDISHGGTIWQNDVHRVDGTGTLGKTFGGPISAGGTVDYLHKPSHSSASVTAMHTPGWGTDVGAQARYNFFTSPNGRTTGSLSGNYDRHFGGPLGTTRPNYGAFLNFNHRF